MNGEDEIKIAKSDYDFRLHMVKFTGATEEAFKNLRQDNTNQWTEINKIKKAPRKMAVIASAVSTSVSATLVGIFEAIRNRG